MNTPNENLIHLSPLGNLIFASGCESTTQEEQTYGESETGQNPVTKNEAKGRGTVAETQIEHPQYAERERETQSGITPGDRTRHATDRVVVENTQPAEGDGGLWRRVSRFLSVGSDKRDDLQLLLENAAVTQHRNSISTVSPVVNAVTTPATKRIPIPLAPTTRAESSSAFRPQPQQGMREILAKLVINLSGCGTYLAVWDIAEGSPLVLWNGPRGTTLALKLSELSVPNVQRKTAEAARRFGIREKNDVRTTE